MSRATFLVGLVLMLAVLSFHPLQAETVTVPHDYATIQEAIEAVQGTTDATVVIDSSETFLESPAITQSLTIVGAEGQTPTIQGVDGYRWFNGSGWPIYETILFYNRSGGVHSLTLRNLTIVTRDASHPGEEFAYDLILSLNSGEGQLSLTLDGVTLHSGEAAWSSGIHARGTWPSDGPQHITVRDSSITIAGKPAASSHGVEIWGQGSLDVSGTTIDMRTATGPGEALYFRPATPGSLELTLEDSVIAMAAPVTSQGAVAVFLVSPGVSSAVIRRNTFNLLSDEEREGTVFGIGAASSTTGTELALESNVFIGTGSRAGYAYSMTAVEGGVGTLVATNNVISNMGRGFVLTAHAIWTQPVGGEIHATLLNNTIDGCHDGGWSPQPSAVIFNAVDEGVVEAKVINNLFTNNDSYGFEAYVDTGGILSVDNSNNAFFNNRLGHTNGVVSIGPDSDFGDPLYMNRGNGDLHIREDSYCIDAGLDDPLLPSTDIEGNPRVLDGDADGQANVDLGAYENATARRLDDVEQDVEDLVLAGELNDGQANSLIAKLENAMRLLTAGRRNAACNVLQAFTNEVNSLVETGELSPESGQALIDALDKESICTDA